MSQRAAVRQYLLEHGSGTKAAIRAALYVENIGRCIDELRDEYGQDYIRTDMVPNASGKGRHAVYVYNGEQQVRMAL